MLKAFFQPESVAVIGASTNPGKLGHAVLYNLVYGGYADCGKIFPINPKAKSILGYPAYPSVLDVTGPIDLAVILVPYPIVPSVLRSCGKKEIPAVILITAGFRESGVEGAVREKEVLSIVKEYGMRLIGPNCLGVMDTHTPLNATFAADSPPKGPMGFMSQSGALGIAILDWAQEGRLGLSKFVSLGNKADVNEVDLLDEWVKDESTRVILIYSEELANGQEFIRVARQVTARKPVIAIKSGLTQSGARAVSSHTGSLAGSEQAYQAAFHQAGVIHAPSLESMFDMALAFAYQPPLQGERIGIVTNAGGPGILATDSLEKGGLTIARLSVDTIKALETHLPPAASATNPVDVLGDATHKRYQIALELVAADQNVDGILAVLVPQAVLDIEAMAKAIVSLTDLTHKPILGCLMGETRMMPGIKLLTQNGIPSYPFPERAANAFRALADYKKIHDRPATELIEFHVDRTKVQQVIRQARSEGRVNIGDAEAREILLAYGFRIPKSRLATSSLIAADYAEKVGFPVALKVASPDILHKTDMGGVILNLRSAAEVKQAFDMIQYRAQRYLPEARIWGCLVQEMIPGGGLEVLVGMNRDPQFGPLVTFGLGGIYVETLKDVTFRIAPFSPLEAAEMLHEIRSHALLDGVRGEPPKDREAIVDALLRVGQLVQDFPEIAELDINPLVVYQPGKGTIAVDMRLILSGG